MNASCPRRGRRRAQVPLAASAVNSLDGGHLLLLGLGLVALAWHTVAPTRPSVRAFGILMALFIVAGFIGFYLHYAGNVEFELEQNPNAARWVLFREAMMGATPALAPGAMIQIGLIGLLYAFVSRERQR